MTIPEATMGKNNFALRDENKIGSAWEGHADEDESGILEHEQHGAP
jgi:hypothetical protein